MNKPPNMRLRKRCTICNPSHLMDNLGPVLRDDVVVEGMCPTAVARVSKQLRAANERERDGMIQQIKTPMFKAATEVEFDDAGIDVEAASPGRICAMCLLGAILILVGIAIGAIL